MMPLWISKCNFLLFLPFLALCTEEDKGGLAVGYDYADEQTEPTTYKKKYGKGCLSLIG